MTAACTGMRRGDVCGLRWNAVGRLERVSVKCSAVKELQELTEKLAKGNATEADRNRLRVVAAMV
ncbi:MAG: hypothetical protein WCR06_11195 [bacterium]